VFGTVCAVDVSSLRGLCVKRVVGVARGNGTETGKQQPSMRARHCAG
jgi:hypothetical protein